MYVCVSVAVKAHICENHQVDDGGLREGVKRERDRYSCSDKNPLPKSRKTSNKLFEKH